MNRIRQCLQQRLQQGKKSLAAYIVHGDPHPAVTLPAMHALVAAGVDIIELGVPFSDPMAEGPVIQRGHERALAHEVSLRATFDLVAQFRQSNHHTPVILMGYVNPIECLGYDACAQQAANAGVDGMLTVDLPAEEAAAFNHCLQQQGIDNIFLVAPTTTEARIRDMVTLAGGFIYYVSLNGVTGAGHLDIDAVHARLKVLRSLSDLPLMVGFGIKDAASAAAVSRVSDGVVVGSVLVEAMGQLQQASEHAICQALTDIITPMRTALDS